MHLAVLSHRRRPLSVCILRRPGLMNTTDHLLVATGRSWPADSLHFAATADQPAAREHRIRRATIACAESRKLLERIDGAANARLLSQIYIPPSQPPQPLARRMELSVNETHLSIVFGRVRGAGWRSVRSPTQERFSLCCVAALGEGAYGQE